MASNSYNTKGALALASWLATFNSQVVDPIGASPYGISEAQETALTDALTALDAANTSLDTQRNAFHAAVDTKDQAMEQTRAAIQSAAKTIYANIAITNQQLIDAGLAVHSDAQTANLPVTPTGFVATGTWNGNELQWERGGNSDAIVFEIERQAIGGAWQIVGSTKKTTYFDSAVTFGAPYYYRVRATNDGLFSTYSDISTVFVVGSEAAISIAA